MCDELAASPVIFNSIVVVFGPAVTVIVPFAVTVESAGFSLNVKTLAVPDGEPLGELDWLAEGSGDGCSAVPTAPHAAVTHRISAKAMVHGDLGIPLQVTGAGRGFPPARIANFLWEPQAW